MPHRLSLKLDSNLVSLRLQDLLSDDDLAPVEVVDVDLTLSAHANAREYYNKRRRVGEKLEKTSKAVDVALLAAGAPPPRAVGPAAPSRLRWRALQRRRGKVS